MSWKEELGRVERMEQSKNEKIFALLYNLWQEKGRLAVDGP
jgi:hypothetical protein